ncbi:MAG: hypothetical protein QOD03_1238, partial [Verrucomicrobiota bacterium]
MSGIICLADIEVNDVLHAWSASNSGMMEGVTIFGAVLLASLLAFIWVAFIRKQKRKRKRHHRDYVKSLPPAEVKADAKRRRSSRSRRHHAN